METTQMLVFKGHVKIFSILCQIFILQYAKKIAFRLLVCLIFEEILFLCAI